MTTQQNTPEPWPTTERRIVACVNACAGISTETLDGSRVVMMDSMDAVIRQRDELAECLGYIEQIAAGGSLRGRAASLKLIDIQEAARVALAKLKGSA